MEDILKQTLIGVKKIEEANKAIVLIHGRGANADDILSLTKYFPLTDYFIAAPEAKNNSWYPYSFMSATADNEPYLTQSLNIISDLVRYIETAGIKSENIYFLGFSQGACLTLEYLARNARQYGGAIAFTGGLIGETLNLSNYSGSFNQTPIFIGTSNPDPHVPVQRVRESSLILQDMGANVQEEIYEYMGHTITLPEIEAAKSFIFKTN